MGIRQWYKNVVIHLHDHGFFALPLYCFRKDHGGSWGFTTGSDQKDDLPLFMYSDLQRMKQPIYRLLTRTDMFPKNSRVIHAVTAANGDGYAALKNILLQAHPVFHDHAATWIRQYPYQVHPDSLLQYRSRFMDFLELRANLRDIESSLDDPHELEIFIHGALYSDFLDRNTREERSLPSQAHKYKGDQLIETLERILMAPNSPRLTASRHGPPRSSDSRYQRRSPRTTAPHSSSTTPVRLHAISLTDPHDADTVAASNSDDTMESLLQDANDLTPPNDDDSHKINFIYRAALYSIKSQPSNATIRPCIVCGLNHRFDGCSVLQDHDFLRQHYIRFCQLLHREQNTRNHRFEDHAGTLSGAPSRPIHALDIAPPDAQDDSHVPDESHPADMDFQRGRFR